MSESRTKDQRVDPWRCFICGQINSATVCRGCEKDRPKPPEQPTSNQEFCPTCHDRVQWCQCKRSSNPTRWTDEHLYKLAGWLLHEFFNYGSDEQHAQAKRGVEKFIEAYTPPDETPVTPPDFSIKRALSQDELMNIARYASQLAKGKSVETESAHKQRPCPICSQEPPDPPDMLADKS